MHGSFKGSILLIPLYFLIRVILVVYDRNSEDNVKIQETIIFSQTGMKRAYLYHWWADRKRQVCLCA
ncbi:MAG: hypothetical protein K0R76_1095 [Alphaproteobacteria bacterium]|jgi:hypothetical protein|nr:hypothetical protein [Alphaproteobacteria bacterium]